jgi:lipid A 3-O-deacylase
MVATVRAKLCVRRTAAIATASILLVLLARAVPAAESGWSLTGIEEDDYFAPHNKDEHYTQGLRISMTSPDVKSAFWNRPFALLPWLFPAAGSGRGNVARRYNLIVLAQNMYTPRERSLAIPDPRDRPYAGWLYTGAGLMEDAGGRRFDELDLKLGVVGPAAQAREVQTDWHVNVIGTKPFLGWASQLHNEPALDLYYDRKWRLLWSARQDGTGWGADVIPQASVRIGNVYDYVGGGGLARIGFDLMTDYGPPHIDLNTGSDYFNPARGSGRWFSFYLFLGTEARLVARNIFLDGNSFEASAHVTKFPTVADGEAGVAFTLWRFRISYTLVYRTLEFVNQEGPDHYGSLSLTYHSAF